MKTLINKSNPQIKISAPEIERRKAMFYQDEHYCLIIKGLPWLDADDWTLVEEEEDIRKVLEKYHLEYVNKGYNDHPLEIAEYFFKLGRNGR